MGNSEAAATVGELSVRCLYAGASMNEARMQNLFCFDNFRPNEIITALSIHGTISLPILQEEFRLALLDEAQNSSCSAEPETVGSGEHLVKQQAASCCIFEAESLYRTLQQTFQTLCDEAFRDITPAPFATPLRLTEIRLQKYAQGSLGITPHIDGERFCNLVCVFIIGGHGRFGVCDDRLGTNPKWIDASPGRVIFLRAPGFLGEDKRPFHFVTDIQDERYTCGLRQRGPQIQHRIWGRE